LWPMVVSLMIRQISCDMRRGDLTTPLRGEFQTIWIIVVILENA